MKNPIKKTRSLQRISYSTVNLSFTTGAGYHYNFSNRLHLKVQPTYRRSITSIIDAPVKNYLYSVGIDFGCDYKY